MSIKPTEGFIPIDNREAPAFTFIDKAHQGKDGKGWRQSKDESDYVQPEHPEAVRPEQWTGDYVIERLIEAFKVDRYCKLERPKQPGSAHPQIEYSDEDREGWRERPAEDNAIIIGPSKRDFDRMEEAFGWLDAYFKISPKAHDLRLYARMKARKVGLRKFCDENGCDKTTMPRRAKAAADHVAAILIICKTQIS